MKKMTLALAIVCLSATSAVSQQRTITYEECRDGRAKAVMTLAYNYGKSIELKHKALAIGCLLYTSPSPRD